MIYAVLCFCLTASIALYLIEPLFRDAKPEESATHPERKVLLSEKYRLEELLRDLELDFSTGKMTEAEYERAQTSLSVKLAKALQALQ